MNGGRERKTARGSISKNRANKGFIVLAGRLMLPKEIAVVGARGERSHFFWDLIQSDSDSNPCSISAAKLVTANSEQEPEELEVNAKETKHFEV